jgi:hypothetical protein
MSSMLDYHPPHQTLPSRGRGEGEVLATMAMQGASLSSQHQFVFSTGRPSQPEDLSLASAQALPAAVIAVQCSVVALLLMRPRPVDTTSMEAHSGVHSAAVLCQRALSFGLLF